MATGSKGLAVRYPLSTVCPLCRRRAWRFFGTVGRRFGATIPYRCSRGHISSKEPRRDEDMLAQKAFASPYVGGMAEVKDQQIKLI